MKKTPYREAIGSLMYAAVATRPDIAFAMSALSQFLGNPGIAHWEAVKRVFRYLAGTKAFELTYGSERQGLEGFTDADGVTQEHRVEVMWSRVSYLGVGHHPMGVEVRCGKGPASRSLRVT